MSRKKNTTLNLPESLITRTRAYAASHGTTMTAIIREHLETVTAEPEPQEDDPLHAYAAGLITREAAIKSTGVRGFAQLLIVLGDAGLTPPRPPQHEIDNEAHLFERIWSSA